MTTGHDDVVPAGEKAGGPLKLEHANYGYEIPAELELRKAASSAFAGFGHRYPTLEIFSKSEYAEPWRHSAVELRGMSDLVHACHAATGAEVACNEEWYHKPPDVDIAMPWRVLLKWRVSTLAGFEGGTKIYLNTIDPWSLRDRVVPKLLQLRHDGHISPAIRIATECDCRPNSLRYNPNLRR